MSVCALPECQNELPLLAIKHGDPFCSMPCARKAHGLEVPPPRTAKQTAASKAAVMPKAPVYVTTGRAA